LVIAKLSREVQMGDFVHEYYSIDRLRKTMQVFSIQ
jgi:hypothetical protein